MDMFTFNGKPYQRMAFHPVAKKMQNWTGLDGEMCGVFGIWMQDIASFQKMCPGENFDQVRALPCLLHETHVAIPG